MIVNDEFDIELSRVNNVSDKLRSKLNQISRAIGQAEKSLQSNNINLPFEACIIHKGINYFICWGKGIPGKEGKKYVLFGYSSEKPDMKLLRHMPIEERPLYASFLSEFFSQYADFLGHKLGYLEHMEKINAQ